MLPSKSRRAQFHLSLSSLTLLLFGLSLAVKLGTTLWLKSLVPNPIPIEYSYIGDDHPARWPIAVPPVLMASDNSHRFQLATPAGAAEWAAIVPGPGPGPAVVRLGPARQPYTLALFHQLRCLDVVRAEMVRDHAAGNASAEATALARHCLNYVKQMVLCRGDLQLEPFLAPSHVMPIDLYGVYECRDWGAVYSAVERNQAEYARWLQSGGD